MCSYIALVTGGELPEFGAPVGGFGPAVRFQPPRDAFWPRSAVAFLVLGAALTLVSTQLVSPSRRLRLARAGPADGPADAGEAQAGEASAPDATR